MEKNSDYEENSEDKLLKQNQTKRSSDKENSSEKIKFFST